ncbi:MAG: hypothetical protein ACTILB_16630 [Brevibacterium aurantiacum]
MNETAIQKLTSEISSRTMWADEAIEETLKIASEKGYLRGPEVKIDAYDIQRGDKIHLVNRHGDPVPTEEIYTASRDWDHNGWEMPDDNFTFYLIDRPEPPKPQVEDLKPGTHFSASMLGDPVAEYVRGRGEEVFQLHKDVGFVAWSATNSDFAVVKVHN